MISCDLINAATEPDFFDKIDEEIAWANAAKISVTVDFPPEQGRSPQVGTNRVTNHLGVIGDVRVGYPFEVEFTPNAEYGFVKWQAFKANDLKNPINDVTLPKLGEDGGKGQFTVNIAENITLVPVLSYPRLISVVPDDGAFIVDLKTPLRFTFATPLDGTTVNYETVTLTMKVIDPVAGHTGDVEWPVTDTQVSIGLDPDDSRTILIQPTDVGLPYDGLITVILGTGIKTLSGNNFPQAFSFSYNTGQQITPKWSALAKKGKIDVTWTQPITAEASLRYRINGEPEKSVQVGSVIEGKEKTISLTSSLAEGSQLFEIRIELLYKGSTTTMAVIEIANIEDMLVSDEFPDGKDPFLLIRDIDDIDSTAPGVRSIRNHLNADETGGKSYVLIRDISITEKWTPLGTEYSIHPFEGKFYGMGKTITLSGGLLETAEYTGFFGFIKEATVQDLTVVYAKSNIQVIDAAQVYFGGIAGEADLSIIKNCHVKSGARLDMVFENINDDGQLVAGGIVGDLSYSEVFTGNTAMINFNVTANTGDDFKVGGIVGMVTASDISECRSSGAMVAKNANNDGGSIPTYVGGFAGYLEGPLEVRNCHSTMDIDIWSYDEIHAERLFGYANANVTKTGCTESGKVVFHEL